MQSFWMGVAQGRNYPTNKMKFQWKLFYDTEIAPLRLCQSGDAKGGSDADYKGGPRQAAYMTSFSGGRKKKKKGVVPRIQGGEGGISIYLLQQFDTADSKKSLCSADLLGGFQESPERRDH